MSKLFDQLKDAAREREGGLLMGALAKKRAEEAAAAAAPDPAEAPSVPPASPSSSSAGSPVGGIALAAAIFGVAVLAWHSAPWRAPQKLKIEPDSLKLDRTFSLDRPSAPVPALEPPAAPSKGTTSPPRPS